MNDPNAVSLAAIALAATTVAGIIWIVKYLANTLSKDIKEHTEAATQLTVAAQQQTKSSNEVLVFMKKLNGKLEGAVIQKVAEQTVEHQTVNVTEEKK